TSGHSAARHQHDIRNLLHGCHRNAAASRQAGVSPEQPNVVRRRARPERRILISDVAKEAVVGSTPDYIRGIAAVAFRSPLQPTNRSTAPTVQSLVDQCREEKMP